MYTIIDAKLASNGPSKWRFTTSGLKDHQMALG